MIYAIKEKFWSLGGQFTITGPEGKPAFQVVGKAFSWGNKLSFQDPLGQELAFIQQRLLAWQPRYEIMRDGRKAAQVVKEWTWLNKKFTLDLPGPNDLTISGSFWDHEFVFSRNGRQVAHVSKNIWSWQDTYGVEISEGEDAVMILCTCIVIDQVLADERNTVAN